MHRMHFALAFGAIVAALAIASKGRADVRPLELVATHTPPPDKKTVTWAAVLEVQTQPVSGTSRPPSSTATSVTRAPVRDVQTQPAPGTIRPPSIAPPPPAHTGSKRVVAYACAACGETWGSDQKCCRECYESRALATRRAKPFDSDEYGAEEVQCTGCDGIMRRPATSNCIMHPDGKFTCQKGAACLVDPVITYEDIVTLA